MVHQPERTCIGCRRTFSKGEVVRLVAAPGGVLVDYREKLPGRGAYVCPAEECIGKALSREALRRALRWSSGLPTKDELITAIAEQATEKLRSLVSMAAKAGKLAAGVSAVQDSLEKGRARMLIFARDLAEGSRKKVLQTAARTGISEATLFTRDEMGRVLGRELVGVLAFEDQGFAGAVANEVERLKRLLNHRQ